MAGSPALFSSVMLCLAALAFGFSRDFGWFLLSLVVLPLLFLIALLCIALALIDAEARRAAAWAPLLVLLAPPLYLAAGASRDRLVFTGWALAHPGILFGDRDRDGLVTGWAGWGMAGSENDAYLAIDPHDAIGTIPAAEAWRKRHRLTCDIVDTRRMWPRFYIVTTYNCTFDGIAEP